MGLDHLSLLLYFLLEQGSHQHFDVGFVHGCRLLAARLSLLQVEVVQIDHASILGFRLVPTDKAVEVGRLGLGLQSVLPNLAVWGVLMLSIL